MFFDPFPPYAAPTYWIRQAREPWELAGSYVLRRRVFCLEQGLVEAGERDAVDDRATAIVAISSLAGAPDQVVGAVRIDERSAGIWWGTRLTVAREHRRAAGLGVALIRFAVGTALGRGAECFFAHVQEANVPLFERLHWRDCGAVELHGRSHRFMEADLAAYARVPDGSGVLARARSAAA